MTDREAMRLALDALELYQSKMSVQMFDAAITALRQALDHVPDTTKMTEPDMGIDRGAWADVPDATKWVDELRGGDEEPSDDDAAWAKHLKEPMSEKRVHESDTMERHVSYVCPQCHWTLEQPDPFNRLIRIMGTFDLATGHADNWNDLLDSLESELRDVLGYYREAFKVEQECSTHPDAPHGFNRDASHNYGRYVCDCEGWEPPHVSQEPQTMPEKTDDVAQETQPEQEPVAWRNAAIRLGEDLYSVGPNGYYDMTASQWLDWALSVVNTEPPVREWIGLTDEEIEYLDMETSGTVHDFVHAIEAKLKEKNGG